MRRRKMKTAIVSDTHDNIVNFSKAIAWCNANSITFMLHCGDICSQSTIDEAKKLFKGEIRYVRGNGDYSLHEIPDTLELDLKGKMVAAVHYPDLAKKLAESGNYDFVFYGHTHKPWLEKVGNCTLANPGEIAGQRFKPTFAVYDAQTDKLELKILEKIEAFDNQIKNT